MTPVKDIVQVKGQFFVVEREFGNSRTLVAPSGHYVDIVQQVYIPSSRENPIGHWESNGGADFCDPFPEEEQLLAETRQSLEAAKNQ